LHTKIKGSGTFKSPQEKTEYYQMFSYATLSQAAIHRIQPRYKLKNKEIPLGANLHHFAIKMMNIDGPNVRIKFGNQTYELKATTLWKILKNYLDSIFGHSQAEALSKSKELPRKDTSGREYVVKGDENE
jgi:hypothetical protein